MNSVVSEPLIEVVEKARAIHRAGISVDGHCDTPYRLKRQGLHLEDQHPEAQATLQLLADGGLSASFFAAYVPPFYANRGAAGFCDELIDLIDAEAVRYPENVVRANSVAEIRAAKRNGRFAILIGIEGGHAIEDSLETLNRFYGRGARYLTLTHVNTNNWADSSGDDGRHGGLTAFGRDVVREMNRLGMIVDISHVADNTFYHALETSSVPVIASHSSCRKLASHPRNLTDQMLRDLASAGGVCMINFFSAFIDDDAARTFINARSKNSTRTPPGPSEEIPDNQADWESFHRWFAKLGCPTGTLDQVADHIVHAASVAGVESVGIGSDFDGVPLLPEGLEDVSRLPWLTARLLERGFHEKELTMILGENFLRAFSAIESGARR
jgi:membrane dipeptidase